MGIICVSNRVSLPDPKTGKISAGGLAVGVREALKAMGGGSWFGWDGKQVNTYQDRDKHGVSSFYDTQNNIDYLTIPLTTFEYDTYYKGMANEGLWPFMHELGDRIDEDGSSYRGYRHVNNLFAKQMKPYIKPDDVIWVHDYHMIPLGKALRQEGITNPILFFNHIPVPSPDFTRRPDISEDLRIHYGALVEDLFAYNQVGFQSFRDMGNFLNHIGASKYPENPTIEDFERFVPKHVRKNGVGTNFGVFPISIETADLEKQAAQSVLSERVQAFKRSVGDQKIIISAERADYTKGLLERANGTSRFLRQYPEFIGKISYRQITPLSREDMNQYRNLIGASRISTATVNAEFGNEAWSPIHASEKMVQRDDLIAMFRLSHAGLVTPLRDGQNLVVKEYVAAQDPMDPGIPILSKEAGAAEEFRENGALIIDPKNPDDIAKKIHIALTMPLNERQDMHHRLITGLRQNDIGNWTRSFLAPYLPEPSITMSPSPNGGQTPPSP